MDEFTLAYIEAMLWSTTDESDPETGGLPLDTNYSADDIAPVTLARIQKDCAAFQEAHGHLFTEENCRYRGCSPITYAGHDFWLTREGHGAGFWDGNWTEPAATTLTDAAKAFGPFDLYVGDDGRIYHG